MLLAALLLLPTVAFGFDLDNAVVGRPDVHCGIDSIAVTVKTEKPFKGRLYVQGESEAEGCLKTAPESDVHPRFELAIGGCNMRRQRTLQPRGVAFSFTLVVSFHPFFVTGNDRAFNVRCFFLESVKSLNTEVDVSHLTTEIVEQDFPLPQCTYELRDGVEGAPLSFAHVGQKVTHRWQCDPAVSWVYGVLIHSCFADDGHGNKFELVDDRGCTTDPSLLPQIQYEESTTTAFTHAKVFKYADKIQLYFTCTVQLCYKHDGGCEGVTPPSCGHAGIPVPSAPSLPIVPSPVAFVHGGSPPRNDKPSIPPHKPDIPQGPPEIPKIPDFVPPDVAGKIGEFLRTSNGKGPEKPRIPEEESDVPRNSEGPRFPPVFRRPYKDSPLNLTDLDEVLTTTEVRRTNVEFSTTPSGTVTVSPGLGEATESPTRTTTETLWPVLKEMVGTTPSLKVFSTPSTTTKARRDLKKMETDLSVDVIVLPPQAETNLGQQKALQGGESGDFCLSRPASIVTVILLLAAIGFASFISFALARRSSNTTRKAHPMVDAFH